MGDIDIPTTVPMIHHTDVGVDWLTEYDWIKRFGMKYGDIRHSSQLTDYVKSDGKTFIIFFTTQFPTGKHAEITQMMAAVCQQKLGLGSYLEIKKIIRYGNGIGVTGDEDVKFLLKDTPDLKLIVEYGIPCAFIGNVNNYDDLLVAIYNKMWGKRL